MKAIILAAGTGSRLGSKSGGLPKAMLRIGNRPLIQHQLEALSGAGVGPILVVVGHRADQVRATLHDAVEYVVNERYAETNSLYSLWLAREWLEGEILLLNSDLLFHPDILRRVLAAPGSALAYDSTSHHGAEQTKVGLAGSRVVDLGKDFPTSGARGESIGLIKLDADATEALRKRTDAIIVSGEEKVWVTEALRSIVAEVPITGVNVAGLPWTEIDFPYDLTQARKVVWPAIERLSHPNRRLWRRLRWPLWAAIVFSVGVSIWFMSALLGPASTDWETLSAEQQDKRVRIQRADKGPQKWALLLASEPLTIDATGGPIRLEARAAFPAEAGDSVAFAIAVDLDGIPYEHLAARVGVDSSVAYAGWRLGERKREKFVLLPGRHTLTLRLIHGNVGAVLVRVRQPEDK